MLKIAEKEDVPVAAELAGMLWPHHSREELEGELLSFIESGGMVFLWMEEGNPVAFAQCGIRTDYVEGTHGGAVGYLEGIFVLGKFRRRGIGRVLLTACEEWAKEQGCEEFASDTELDNAEGLSFHSGAGFYEANRIVCFVKNL